MNRSTARSSRTPLLLVLLPAVAVIASASIGCSSGGSGSSASPSPSPASPAPAVTPYLGIERIDKVFVPALKKNVLVVTLAQMPRGVDPNGLASAVYAGIKGSLEKSNFDLAVVKIPMASTTNSSTYTAIVYARDPKGNWTRTLDPAVVEAIDAAGI